MPIIVPCPQCATRLSAPDSAAGKHVRCPKFGCGAIAAVPALLPVEEVPVVDAAIVPSKPKRVAAVTDDDDRPRTKKRRREDEDDDYDFDHPRRKRKKKSGMGVGAIVAIVFGSLVLLTGVGFGVYALVGKKSGADSAKKTRPPAGWQQFTYEKDGFRAYFLHEPRVERDARRGPVSMVVYEAGLKNEELMAGAMVLHFPPEVEMLVRQKFMTDFRSVFTRRGDTRVSGQRSITWAGYQGEEIRLEGVNVRSGSNVGMVIRYVITPSAGYFAMIGGTREKLTPELENAFFDNFELLK